MRSLQSELSRVMRTVPAAELPAGERSELARAIVDAIIAAPYAWSRIESLARQVDTHHPDSVRREIRTLCDAGVLVHWPLAQGQFVTLSVEAARSEQRVLTEVTFVDDDGAIQEEAPRWLLPAQPGTPPRVHQQRAPRVPLRIAEIERRLRAGVADDEERQLSHAFWRNLRPPRPIEPAWLEPLSSPVNELRGRLWAKPSEAKPNRAPSRIQKALERLCSNDPHHVERDREVLAGYAAELRGKARPKPPWWSLPSRRVAAPMAQPESPVPSLADAAAPCVDRTAGQPIDQKGDESPRRSRKSRGGQRCNTTRDRRSVAAASLRRELNAVRNGQARSR